MWVQCICFVLAIVVVQGANILCLMQTPLYSHYMVHHTLYKELAVRGHNVTLISPFKEDLASTNFTSILFKLDPRLFKISMAKIYESAHTNIIMRNIILEEEFFHLTEAFLNYSKVQEVIKSEKKFDLVIMPQHQNEAMKGFCHHFQAPCILLAPMAASRWSNPYMSNSGPPSYVPEFLGNFQSEINFMERFYNSVTYFINYMHTYIVTHPKHDLLLKKYFPNPPSLYDLMYNASLMLVNSHYSIRGAVPYGPNIVEVGGMHVKQPKPLPADIQDFLNNAAHGAIYFSLGSGLPPGVFSKDIRNSVLNVFGKLKQKVLFKGDEDDSIKIENIRELKWLPQNDVLAHPNVKVFVTQGGQMSMTEAVYHEVPVLGMPIWVDQYTNVMNGVKLGYALSLPINNFSEEKFEKALHELLYNTSYSNNVRKQSVLFHDRPMQALDTAVFWVEHIIKHGGGSHLRTAASNLTWYQYFLIDVIIAITLTVALGIVTILSAIKILRTNQINSTYDSKKNK